MCFIIGALMIHIPSLKDVLIGAWTLWTILHLPMVIQMDMELMWPVNLLNIFTNLSRCQSPNLL